MTITPGPFVLKVHKEPKDVYCLPEGKKETGYEKEGKS
jgi:hypothetical protein